MSFLIASCNKQGLLEECVGPEPGIIGPEAGIVGPEAGMVGPKAGIVGPGCRCRRRWRGIA